MDETTEDQVAECVDAVMLDVEFTPVLESPTAKDPTEVTKDEAGNYRLTYRNAMFPDATVYEPVTEGALKVMRARYLVTRGNHYRSLPALPRDERNRVLDGFFGGSAWTPKAGTDLARKMGMAEPLTYEAAEDEIRRLLRARR